MLVQVVKGLTELNHFTTDPVLPDNVNVPLVEPEHIVEPPVTPPPTEPGLTVTVVADDVAGVHDPF
jgi:hypothetical protein